MEMSSVPGSDLVKAHSRANINQTYSNNAPKIMLETISARTATIVLCVTYVTFVLAFLFDLRSTLQGFRDGNQVLSSATCSSQEIVVGLTDETFGCTLVPINETDPTQEVIWAGHVRNFENVISVALQSKFKNVTGVLMNGTLVDDDAILDDLKFDYDIDLYCCYQNSHCGDISVVDIGKTDTGTDWMLVLSSKDTVVISNVYQVGEDSATIQLLPNIFQNQETLPDNGKIKSYLVFVTYRGKQPYFQSESDMTYKFANINRASSLAARILLQFCIFFTLVMIIVYIRALKSRYTSLYHALPEQRWILLYMIALVLFQNPVYSVVVWTKEPSPEVVFSAYVIDAAAQASFFTLWLILADGWKRQIAYYSFYLPKIAMGLVLFATNLVILILQFPSVSPSMDRSPVVAVDMWSKDTKLSLIVFSLSFLSLLWIWAAWWLYNLYITGRTLHQLPYMSTRYLQLWFRFFTLQATLVTLYYLFQYFVTVYFIVHYVETVTVEAFADGINTLFRQQSLLFGKVVFLTVYALILVFFFLPAGFLEDSDSTVTSLTATYVLHESEILPIYRTRSRAIRKMKALSLNQITHANPYVLCVDLGLELLELAWQAYNDPKTYKTESGYGTIDVEDLGYTLLNHAYDSDYDTVCFIFRHNTDPKIVVCFRGTCSKKHWASNLKYKPHPVNVASMTLNDLDQLDGLNIAPVTPRTAHDGNRGFFDFPHLLSFDVLDQESDEESSDEESPDFVIDDETPDERRRGRKSLAKGVTIAATRAASMAVGATTGLLTVAAAHTPGLEDRVQTSLHSGFWEAYCTVRGFIHTVIRQELAMRPAHVYCTGHSLGGALATIASLDLAIHTIPRVNKYLRALRIRKLMELSEAREGVSGDLEAMESVPDYRHPPVRRVKLCVYTFGAPRVGNYAFAQQVNHWVPNNFRIVVDGDLVSGVPKTGFKHGGTEIIIDSLGAGSIIIDPSFVEKILRTQNRTSMSVHSLNFYRRGLQGVMAATEYVRQHSALPNVEVHNDGSTARENALIAAQMRLALESGLAAIRSAIFHEKARSKTLDEINTPLQESLPISLTDTSLLLSHADSDEFRRQQEKHDLDVLATDEVAKNVIISQRSFLETVTDYSTSLWSSLFTPKAPQDESPQLDTI